MKRLNIPAKELHILEIREAQLVAISAYFLYFKEAKVSCLYKHAHLILTFCHLYTILMQVFHDLGYQTQLTEKTKNKSQDV